ncbi:MAG: F0F1 ATP synthase subunit epsilon [Silicimonas sp.]|nr:F0F1 ATP synthase subunit epsilon [Silicimonas sp.]NND17492.1 F0F1 ATP synthase subunit epsilon [Silicimonas sp.]NND22966.1 F0F1 ATP synthase subunit epsilon [Silicimonas sp.]NND42760.1 F0F1 ATP synthase subunit epsilon [Silicimonas sp.]NNF90907.1 F0F1 ATP synthase subunit epsilon [Boseongicola sp.]
MADTFQFDLVSPERRLASGQATAVRIPGADGDLTAMPDHAPLVTTLRPGILVVEMDGGEEEYAVIGGFAQITADGATVLADEAMPRSEITSEYLNARIAKAREDHAASTDTVADDIAKFLSDLVAMGDHIGIPVESRAPAP